MALIFAFDAPAQVILSGATRGLAFGVFAVGIILIYKSNRVFNLALGEIGALCAAIFVRLTVNYHWNFYPALVLSLVVGTLIGGLLELALVPRLRKAPKVILLVATIGAAQALLFAQGVLPDISAYEEFPTAFDEQWELGGMIVRSDHVVAAVVLPALVAGLAWFLVRTKFGTAVRAAAENPDAARLSGISIKQMSLVVWALAGGLAAVATILSAPLANANVSSTGQLGPAILVRTLAIAVIAGMSSMSIAMLSGVALGVGEAVIFYNRPEDPGVINFVLFVVVLVAVLAVSARNRSLGTRERFSLAPRTRPIPESLRDSWFVRHHARIGATLMVLVAAVLPLLVTSQSRQFLYSQILLMALTALSLTVLTGWAGQLSLGQFALVGLGGMTTYALFQQQLQYPIAVLAGAAAAAGAAAVVGLPALRMRGLFLAVTTLSLAVAAPWLLERPIFQTEGQTTVFMPRPIIGSVSLESQRTYYYVCLAVLVLVVIAIARLRASGLGRVLLAVRDNELAAAAMGLSPTRVKLSAFAISGALAGLAGGLLVGLLEQFTTSRFGAVQSLQVIGVAVVGGLASIAGAVLGAVVIVGLPAFFPNSQQAALLTSAAGILILLLYFPGGLIQILYNARDVAFSALAKRRPAPEAASERPKAVAKALPPRPSVPDHVRTALRTHEVTVSFGARQVVQSVSVEVGRHEVVGLIGANGAGKSTLMNAIGGYVPCTGRAEILEQPVDSAPPHRRSAIGLGRTFQDAALFGDLSVRETVQVAVEARARARLVPVVLSLPRARRDERAKRAHADEILDFLGLGAFAERFISELSTGTRRIVEFACLLASDAKVLCLDEPTAGVAQREAEAFGPLLLQVRRELDAAMLIIEHDMPLVMSVSDRIYCLEAGRVISNGTPSEVRSDPLVVASYLGTDVAAIERSGRRTADELSAP